MKWVNPNDEMPKRYITILIAIQYPQHNRAFTITTGLYTGDGTPMSTGNTWIQNR